MIADSFYSRVLLTALLLLALAACSTVVRVPVRAVAASSADATASGQAAALEEARSGYARVLQRHVKNLSVDDAQRTVFFNEILKFYTEDFVPAHAPTLIAYAQRYSSQTIPPDFSIAFRPYDWTIANSRRARP